MNVSQGWHKIVRKFLIILPSDLCLCPASMIICFITSCINFLWNNSVAMIYWSIFVCFLFIILAIIYLSFVFNVIVKVQLCILIDIAIKMIQIYFSSSSNYKCLLHHIRYRNNFINKIFWFRVMTNCTLKSFYNEFRNMDI